MKMLETSAAIWNPSIFTVPCKEWIRQSDYLIRPPLSHRSALHGTIIFPSHHEVTMRLYVGNLSKEVTKEDLEEAFKVFGQVDEVTIVRDRSNNVSKGFGFVEMPEKAEAEAAIAGLHRKEFKGQSMDVNEARPRPEHRGFGGGGRHSGGGRRW
jgi:RNA recognition motif-containing protein